MLNLPRTRVETLRVLSARADIPQSRVDAVFRELSKLVRESVNRTGEFLLPGLGKFVHVRRRARRGFDPNSGIAIEIPAADDVQFRVSPTFKETVFPGRKQAVVPIKPAPAKSTPAPAKSAAKKAAAAEKPSAPKSAPAKSAAKKSRSRRKANSQKSERKKSERNK